MDVHETVLQRNTLQKFCKSSYLGTYAVETTDEELNL